MTRRAVERDDEQQDPTSDTGLISYLEDLEWNDTNWRLNRARDGSPGEPGPFLTKGTGEITEDTIFERFGGGEYVLSVKRPNEGWKRYPISIEGDPVPRAARAGTTATPATPDPIRALRDQLEAVRLEQQIATLRAELARAATPAPTPERDPFELIERVLRIQRELTPSRGEGGGLGFSDMLAMFEKGMEAAAHAEGRGDMSGVIREGLELAREIFGRRATTTTSAPVPNGSSPAARIVRNPELETAAELARFLERGLTKGTAPDDLADAADSIFSDGELAVMRLAGVEDVMRRLTPVMHAHPALAQPAAQQYVAQWLEQLRLEPVELKPTD